MPWSIPDDGEALSTHQSVLFQVYLDALVEAINGTHCVLSGGAVSPNAGLVINVAKAATLSNSVLRAVTAGTVTIATADATNPRFDLVVVDSAGVKQVRTGTAAAFPNPPVRTANDVLLAVVYVPAAATAIAANQIVDLRVLRTQGPITINKVTTPVVFNNTATIQTYFSLVLPNGLFLAGKALRINMGGDFLMNNGTPTVTLTVSFGGTVMFADASAVFSTSAVRRPWSFLFLFTAQGNADQEMIGMVNLPGGAALTAPATGIGDIAATAGQTNPISGIETFLDCDAADRTVLVQMTMSVANAGNEIRMESATAELV